MNILSENNILELILTEELKLVENVLETDIDDIDWNILDAETYRTKRKESKVKTGGGLAFCTPSTNQVYLSEVLFEKNLNKGLYINSPLQKTLNNIELQERQFHGLDLTRPVPVSFQKRFELHKIEPLISVILDELAHMKTRKNHENDEYEQTLDEYVNKMLNHFEE